MFCVNVLLFTLKLTVNLQTMTIEMTQTATMTEEFTSVVTATMTDFMTVTDEVTMTDISTVLQPTTYVQTYVQTSIIDNVSHSLFFLYTRLFTCNHYRPRPLK